MKRRLQISRADAPWIAGAGALAGVLAALLTRLGNPIDGGVSIACFTRDIAGALGLHQYIEFSAIRPELIAIILGATIIAFIKHDFRPTQGSSPIIRFFIGMLLSFGVFVFIGCPMRVGLRLAGGDPAALYGLAGLIAGVWVGTFFLRQGFALGPSAPTTRSNGVMLPAALLLLLVLSLAVPGLFITSRERHAPVLAALVAGCVIGIAGQRTRLCFIGGIRNFLLIGDMTLLSGFAAFILAALGANILLGQAHFGVHIIGSSNALWSFCALLEVGIACTMLGGCPFRQLVLAGQGNGDSAVALLGIMAGAAIAYNLSFAYVGGSADLAGKAAVIGGIAALCCIALFNRER
jgi:hypothetical protein